MVQNREEGYMDKRYERCTQEGLIVQRGEDGFADT